MKLGLLDILIWKYFTIQSVLNRTVQLKQNGRDDT